MLDLEVSDKSLKVHARDFATIANLLQPGIVFVDSPSPSPVRKTKIIQIGGRQCYGRVHTFLLEWIMTLWAERLNACRGRRVSRSGQGGHQSSVEPDRAHPDMPVQWYRKSRHLRFPADKLRALVRPGCSLRGGVLQKRCSSGFPRLAGRLQLRRIPCNQGKALCAYFLRLS